MAAEATEDEAPGGVSWGEALRVWVRVALLSFGGPAGQIAVMHRILVEEKRWISETRFLHALNYCMLLPGPEAQQLATYVGWLLHRTAGGLVAGGLFVLPGFLSILLLSVLYAFYQDYSGVQALFFGLKPAVIAVVFEAVLRIGRRALKNVAMVLLAAAAFVAIFVFEVPFPMIVIGGGLVGFLGGRFRPESFLVVARHGGAPDGEREAVIGDGRSTSAKPSLARTVRVASLWGVLWLLPVAGLAYVTGTESVYTSEALFFSKTAVVTFGGAYAVLAYIAQQGVSTYGWLQPGEMLDGLGMAETTPGPLIQVVQFVAFMGAYRDSGAFSPLVGGILGSLVATWVTFVPCFLWIFLGAPYIEALRGRQGLNAALSGITAVVVGVILNLSLWFALHTLFAEVNEHRIAGMRLLVPEWQSLDSASALITLVAFLLLFRFHLGMVRTLAGTAFLGLAYHLLIRG